MKEGDAGPPNRELYALLHLSPEASDEEIRKAYRQWAQIYHPDKYQAPHVCFKHFLLFFPPYLCMNIEFLSFDQLNLLVLHFFFREN